MVHLEDYKEMAIVTHITSPPDMTFSIYRGTMSLIS